MLSCRRTVRTAPTFHCENNSMDRLLRNPKITLLAIVFLAIHLLVFNNVWHLSKDLIYGDNSAQELIPSPRYEFWRIPDSNFTRGFQGQNRLAADFAQIYFPAQDESISAYTEETLDPWGRPSRYAPVLHELCRLTICNLSYGPASAVHLLVQSILFFVSFLYAFVILDIRKYALLGIFVLNVCLFLSPVGLSSFERGQFSLYVALSYLWLFLGLIRHNYAYLVLPASVRIL